MKATSSERALMSSDVHRDRRLYRRAAREFRRNGGRLAYVARSFNQDAVALMGMIDAKSWAPIWVSDREIMENRRSPTLIADVVRSRLRQASREIATLYGETVGP